MVYTALFLFGMGIIGQLLHILMKLDSLNKQTDGVIDWKKFIRLERFAIAISFIVVLASSILSQEVKELAFAGKWLGLGQIGIGYFAQSILIKLSNLGSDKIDKLLK